MILSEEEDNNDKHQQQQVSSSPQTVCTRKQHRTTLPTEIINEILLKLPVESLLRCTSVCKSWYSLITDPHFIESHLNRSAHPTLFLLTGFLKYQVFNTCCLSDVMDGNIVNAAFEVVDYPLRNSDKIVRVVGSCNGLLCIVIENDDDKVIVNDDDNILFIWNPSTRKFNELPSDGYRTNVSRVHFSFGYDKSSNDYKVVAVSVKLVLFEFETFVKMYSLRDGSWKDISVFFIQSVPSDGMKLLNGVLHWVVVDGDDRLTMNSFDLATNTYGEVMQPMFDEGETEMLLETLGDSLCVICDYYEVRVDLWVMKALGVRDTWTKVISVSYVPGPMRDFFFDPVCISNDGKVLFILGTRLMIYDSNNRSFSDVKNFDGSVEASTFVESLVSPMPPAAATLGHRVVCSNE